MSLRVWNGSQWISIKQLKVWNGSQWVASIAGKVWNGSSWVQFFSNLTATISPTTVSGSATRFGAGGVYVPATPTAVVTVSGGVAPYAYLWTYVSGTAAGFNSSSTGSSMNFFRNMTVGIGDFIEETGYYNCRVTDNAGTIIYSNSVLVSTTAGETS